MVKKQLRSTVTGFRRASRFRAGFVNRNVMVPEPAASDAERDAARGPVDEQGAGEQTIESAWAGGVSADRISVAASRCAVRGI